MKENSKEEIKNRMIKKAADLWNVPANEIEMSFDPIVSLLIAACASELEKISGEVDKSQTRITEKLIQLMTPEAVYGPRPAHAILHAAASDDSTTVYPEFMFGFKQESAFKKSSIRYKDIYFSPIKEFKLINANIRYMATGSSLLEFEEYKQKSIVSSKLGATALDHSSLYLGISSESDEIDLKDLSFYFEMQDSLDKELFYHHLRDSSWEFGEEKLDVKTGFFGLEDHDKNQLKAIFEDVSNKSVNVIEQTLNIYEKYFVTTTSSTQKVKTSSFPELDKALDKSGAKLDGEIRWIKVTFPRIISNSTLANLYCSLNSFPVLNRELHSFSYKLREFVNIVPVKTDDLFFDLHAFSNTDGKKYVSRNSDNSKNDKGTFEIRADDLGKLDKRKAREYLIHLIELLKDESASFSFMNNDFLYSNLKSLNQNIALLENKVRDSDKMVTETTYIMVKPFVSQDNLLIDYWTTNGVLGNDVKSGSQLSLHKGIGVATSNIFMMTTSHGGKDDLNMEDRLHSYKSAILSRDRIVTKEDIKALCYEMYGEKISEVSVSKSYTQGIGRQQGLIQCIEIGLSKNEEVKVEMEEWDSLNTNLMHFLKKKSTNVFPYKIKILN